MKKKDIFLLLLLLCLSGVLIAFSSRSREGAYNGLVIAENTIIPSLLPLLIIFLLIMKSGAKDVLARSLGFISVRLFRLPSVTLPAIFFGLVGGYPTGALLTYELLKTEEIDDKQARNLLRFNFCGGCGFIITGVGSGILHNQRAGVLLFFANVISSLAIGILLSLFNDKPEKSYYSYTPDINIGDALISATSSSVNSVLNIIAYIILFSAFAGIIAIPKLIMPLLEITNGVCNSTFSLSELSAYLAFGGICIHLQLLPIISKAKMKYVDFFSFRVINALISYAVMKLLCLVFPSEISVFSNISNQQGSLSTLNTGLSFLLVIGAVVLVLDVNDRKRRVDKI